MKDFNVALIVLAPRYNQPSSHSNDIALVKLAEAADLTVYTPACLPTTNQGLIATTTFHSDNSVRNAKIPQFPLHPTKYVELFKGKKYCWSKLSKVSGKVKN